MLSRFCTGERLGNFGRSDMLEKMYRVSSLMPPEIMQWPFEHRPYVVPR